MTDLEIDLRPRHSLGPILGIGLGAAAMPLLVRAESIAIRETNGIADITYRDYVAIGCGAIAIVLAIVLVVSLLTKRDGRRPMTILGTFLIALLGTVQIARGFGAFASVPNDRPAIGAIE